MKAILIDPGERSLSTIEIPKAGEKTTGPQMIKQLKTLYSLVGEECLDAAYILPGESIIVADHSALQDPPLPSYFVRGHRKMHLLYGKGVVIGYDRTGCERETKLSVDDMHQLITWNQ